MGKIEILSSPGCSRCIATKIELKKADIEFHEVNTMTDPSAAEELMARFAQANNGISEKTAPLVLITKDGDVVDYWSGKPDRVVDRAAKAVR